MATGTNGIATKGDINAKVGFEIWLTDTHQCPTKSEILQGYYHAPNGIYRPSIVGTYANNQLVKYSDIYTIFTPDTVVLTINFGGISVTDGTDKADTTGWSALGSNVYQRTYQIPLYFYKTGHVLFKTINVDITFTATLEGRFWDSMSATIQTVTVQFDKNTQIESVALGTISSMLVYGTYSTGITMDVGKTITISPISVDIWG